MFEQALSLVVLFCVGLAGRRLGLFTTEDAKAVSKVVLYVTMPALAFLALSDTSIRVDQLLVLPIAGLVIPLLLLAVSALMSRSIQLPRKTLAVFLGSATVANLGYFLYPFFDTFYGDSGLAYLVVFDIGNTIVAYTVTYYIAVSSSEQNRMTPWGNMGQILKFPPLWATILGLSYVLLSRRFSLALPSVVTNALAIAAHANSLLAILILGIHFRLNLRYPVAMLTAVAIRMLGGLMLGISAANLLGLDGMARIVVSIAPGMPVGLNNLIYAARFDLDAEFAASLITTSLLVGFFIILGFTKVVM